MPNPKSSLTFYSNLQQLHYGIFTSIVAKQLAGRHLQIIPATASRDVFFQCTSATYTTPAFRIRNNMITRLVTGF